MWHEARKQERRIRGMIVDYRKRAERRQDFYEKIKADPTQFIQVHGRRCKIHLDPAVAAAGDGAAIIVPWQGQADNLIDRFDVRAHLDFIPAVAKSAETDGSELSVDERHCNYERYRILAQNDFLGVSEEKFLHQLYLEEQYGVNAQLEAERNASKKKQQKSGATIGYSYSDADSTAGPQPFSHLMQVPSQVTTGPAKSDKGSDSESDSDMDMDVAIDITKLDTAQAHELNACGRNFGMISNDFYSYLTKDADEADALRLAREEEQEKMLLSGRRSRRERRAQKERRIASRPFSPPSYAAKEDLEKKDKQEEDSDSRSPSPADANAGKITYITSFGGEDELQPHSKISINIAKGAKARAETSASTTYAQKVKENLDKLKQLNEPNKSKQRRHPSDSRSRSRSRSRRRDLRHRSRTRSRERRRRRERHSRSSSYEHSRHLKRSKRSRSRSRDTQRRRYRSISRSSRSSSGSSRRSRSRKPTSAKSKRTPPPTSVLKTTTTQQAQNTPLGAVRPVKTESSQMISYPLPARVLSVPTAVPAATQVNVPFLSAAPVAEPPPPPLKRYYGRKRGNDSSSNSGSDVEDGAKEAKTHADTENDSDEHMDVDTTSDRSNPLPSSSSTSGKQTGKYSTTQAKNPSYSNATETKGTGGSRLNLRERLKKKMQNLINKQYKADKRAEIEKSERERQQQQEREDEMRELALKLRRRQRELRHKYGTPSSGKASESDASDTAQSQQHRRSPSEVTEPRVPVHNSPPRGQREAAPLQRRRGSRSASRSRRRTRSRSRSHSRHQQRRSRSRSRKYRRSASRSRRQRDASGERSMRSRHGERYRHRSRSRTDRDRDRERERNRDRDYGRDDRERNRDRPNVGRAASDASGNSRTSKIVISAPPKLKKLVDY